MSQLTALLVKQMEFKEPKAFAYRYSAEAQVAYFLPDVLDGQMHNMRTPFRRL